MSCLDARVSRLEQRHTGPAALVLCRALPEDTAAVTVDSAVYRRRPGETLAGLVERAGAGRAGDCLGG